MLGASLPGNILAGKGIDRAGEGVVRAGYGRHSLNSSTSYKNKKGEKNKKKETRIWKQNEFLIPPHPLTNFEIQKYYQNEPRFNGVCSRDNLQKIKDGAYIINLDEYSDIGTHWVALYVQSNDVTYFDSFRAEHIPKEIRTFLW